MMQEKDLHIRKELELESFLQKLDTEKDRKSDSERLRSHVRRELLTKTPREIRDLFPDLWEEYKVHSKSVEAIRKKVLEVITQDDFDIKALEQSIAESIASTEGKDFAFRAHQADGLEKIGEFFRDPGRRSGYIKLPTGMGKTILFSALIRVFCEKNPDTRVLILSPRDIVNKQNFKAIERMQAPDTRVGITQKGEILDSEGNIMKEAPNALVSTYQLLAGSAVDDQRFGRADVIILDELHRSFGIRTVEALKSSYPNAIFLGLSATPYLGDPSAKNPKRAEDYIGECIMSISLPEAIESGALTPVRGFLVHTQGEEIDKLIQSGEDLSDAEYEEKIDGKQRSEIALKILGDYMEAGTKKLTRRAIIYCAGIKHTEDTAKLLAEAGIRVAHIHSKMGTKDITKIIEAYKTGEYDVMCNSDMLIEGFDDEGISLLINLRPTRSLTVFEQMIGRALRLDANNPGKVANVYNVTGKFSEEYTIYGLAKHYKKLENTTKNGSLVFPTKLSDIERKIQKYEIDGIIPNWTEEEQALMREYLPEWFSHFFVPEILVVNNKIKTYQEYGVIPEWNDDEKKLMKIYLPKWFAFFSLPLVRIIEKKIQEYLEDGVFPMWNNDERDLMKQFLRKWFDIFFSNNHLSSTILDLSEPIKTDDIETFRFPMDYEYFQNVENLKTDYEAWMKEWKNRGGITKWNKNKPSLSDGSIRFIAVNGCEISMTSYINRLRRTISEIEKYTQSECFDWIELKVSLKMTKNEFLEAIKNEFFNYSNVGEVGSPERKKASYDELIENGINNISFQGYNLNKIIKILGWISPEKIPVKYGLYTDFLDWLFRTSLTDVTNIITDIESVRMQKEKELLEKSKEILEKEKELLEKLSNIRIQRLKDGEIIKENQFNDIKNYFFNYSKTGEPGSSLRKGSSFTILRNLSLDEIRYIEYKGLTISELAHHTGWSKDKILSTYPEFISFINWLFLSEGGYKESEFPFLKFGDAYFQNIKCLKYDYNAANSECGEKIFKNSHRIFVCSNGEKKSVDEYLEYISDYVDEMRGESPMNCLTWWKKQI